MKTNILTIAIALSDRDLLARIEALASTEREATADLVAHLAALELAPKPDVVASVRKLPVRKDRSPSPDPLRSLASQGLPVSSPSDAVPGADEISAAAMGTPPTAAASMESSLAPLTHAQRPIVKA